MIKGYKCTHILHLSFHLTQLVEHCICIAKCVETHILKKVYLKKKEKQFNSLETTVCKTKKNQIFFFNLGVLSVKINTCICSLHKITDFTPPVCEIVSINANCTSNCSLSSWELTANITDGNGTGIMSLTVRQGLGNLNTSTMLGDRGVNVTLAHYRASCCSQEMELVAVDGAGNVGTCSKSIRPDVATPITSLSTVTTTKKTTITLLSSTHATTNSAGHSLYVSLWVTVEALLLFHVLCFKLF